MTLVVRDFAKVEDSRSTTNKELRQELKEQYGIIGRRLDNFTLSGMKSLANLQATIESNKPVALIGAAQYFSIDLLQSLVTQVTQNQEIKPLDFVATVGNSANYYLAKQFNLTATNLFLGCTDDSLNKAFQVAELELLSNGTQQAVVVIWREDNTRRECYSFLVELDTADIPPQSWVNTLADCTSGMTLPCYWQSYF